MNDLPKFLVQAYRQSQAAPFFSTVKRAKNATEARKLAKVPSGAVHVTVEKV